MYRPMDAVQSGEVKDTMKKDPTWRPGRALVASYDSSTKTGWGRSRVSSRGRGRGRGRGQAMRGRGRGGGGAQPTAQALIDGEMGYSYTGSSDWDRGPIQRKRKMTSGPTSSCPTKKLAVDGLMLPVECDGHKAELVVSLISPGRGYKLHECVKFQNGWFTPVDFVHACRGKRGDINWKLAVRHNGHSIHYSLKHGIISPNSNLCRCDGCRQPSPEQQSNAEPVYLCVHCDAALVTKEAFIKHTRDEHGSPYKLESTVTRQIQSASDHASTQGGHHRRSENDAQSTRGVHSYEQLHRGNALLNSSYERHSEGHHGMRIAPDGREQPFRPSPAGAKFGHQKIDATISGLIDGPGDHNCDERRPVSCTISSPDQELDIYSTTKASANANRRPHQQAAAIFERDTITDFDGGIADNDGVHNLDQLAGTSEGNSQVFGAPQTRRASHDGGLDSLNHSAFEDVEHITRNDPDNDGHNISYKEDHTSMAVESQRDGALLDKQTLSSSRKANGSFAVEDQTSEDEYGDQEMPKLEKITGSMPKTQNPAKSVSSETMRRAGWPPSPFSDNGQPKTNNSQIDEIPDIGNHSLHLHAMRHNTVSKSHNTIIRPQAIQAGTMMDAQRPLQTMKRSSNTDPIDCNINADRAESLMPPPSAMSTLHTTWFDRTMQPSPTAMEIPPPTLISNTGASVMRYYGATPTLQDVAYGRLRPPNALRSLNSVLSSPGEESPRVCMMGSETTMCHSVAGTLSTSTTKGFSDSWWSPLITQGAENAAASENNSTACSSDSLSTMPPQVRPFPTAISTMPSLSNSDPSAEPNTGSRANIQADDLILYLNQIIDKVPKTTILNKLAERRLVYTCVCGLIFSDEPTYHLHRSSHDTSDPLLCSFCRHRASNWYDFMTHQYSHPKPKTFI